MLQGGGHFFHRLLAVPHGVDGAVNQGLGGLGGLVRLGGQIAHLVGHDCKALSGGAGPRGLYGGVQGQDVGLEGDTFDGRNDFADFLGGDENLLHSPVQLFHVFHAHIQLSAGLLDHLTHLPCGGGGLLGALGDAGDGEGQLLHRAGLTGGALGQGLCAGGELVRPGGHLTGGLGDLPQSLVQLAFDAVQGFFDGDEIAYVLLLGLHGQVAHGDSAQHHVDLPDVVPQPDNDGLEGPGQLAHLVVGLDLHSGLPPAGQAQVALEQMFGYLCDFAQGGGHMLFEENIQAQDADDDSQQSGGRGQEDDDSDPVDGGLRGKTGKDQAGDRAAFIPDGHVGADVVLPQDIGVANIGFPLLKHNSRQL